MVILTDIACITENGEIILMGRIRTPIFASKTDPIVQIQPAVIEKIVSSKLIGVKDVIVQPIGIQITQLTNQRQEHLYY